MMNVYDIRNQEELYFILDSSNKENNKYENKRNDSRIIVIMYLYYEEMLEQWVKYIKTIPVYVTCLIISSNEKIINFIRGAEELSHIKTVKKPNVGRDISALLVTAKKYIESADYVCFVHDKKEHRNFDRVRETDFWVYNMWENTLASRYYIEKIIDIFEKNNDIGVLTVPEPIGYYFDAWSGQGWYGSYNVTKRLADKLGLYCEISPDKPPITIGTALWFRVDALRKLIDYSWSYSDFNDEHLADDNYVSYAVERIFPYVAQDAGYNTGTVMTLEYAKKQTAYAQDISTLYAKTLKELLGLSTADECVSALKIYNELNELIVSFDKIYLYGAGHWGNICLKLLRLIEKKPECIFVTDTSNESELEGVPIIRFGELSIDELSLIIVSVSRNSGVKKIIKMLDDNNYNYYWIGI